MPAAVGDRWQVDETYVKVAGQWRYVHRALDQFGQVIDVFVSTRRDATAACRFFERAVGATKVRPIEVVTDQAPVSPAVLEALLRPMRGLKQDRSVWVIIAGHAFVQNHRRGHYELAVDQPANRRVAVAFDELVLAD
jgi:transposase, IS6 family